MIRFVGYLGERVELRLGEQQSAVLFTELGEARFGFAGEENSSSFVREVRAASSWPTETR